MCVARISHPRILCAHSHPSLRNRRDCLITFDGGGGGDGEKKEREEEQKMSYPEGWFRGKPIVT